MSDPKDAQWSFAPFNTELKILYRGLGKSLKQGGNVPARGENENDGVVLAGPTAQNCVLWVVNYIKPLTYN